MNYSIKKINLTGISGTPEKNPEFDTDSGKYLKTSRVLQDTNRTTACPPFEKIADT